MVEMGRLGKGETGGLQEKRRVCASDAIISSIYSQTRLFAFGPT